MTPLAKLAFLSLLLVSANIPLVAKTHRLDLSIGGVELENPDSFRKIFRNLKLDWEGSMPEGVLRLSDAKQKKTLYFIFHPGSLTDSVAEAEVVELGQKGLSDEMLHGSANLVGDYNIRLPDLVSEKGIRLGLTEKQVVDILGKPNKRIASSKGIKLFYQEDINLETETDETLKAINMPFYYGEYEFEKGHLKRFAFGFEYP